MSQPSPAPRLTPQFCFNQTALRGQPPCVPPSRSLTNPSRVTDFLRISRSTIDDSITQNLNALLTPAQRGFDPSSTSTRQLASPARSLPQAQCDEFKQRVLFPSWAVRSDVLDYCAGVATSPDPDDPDSVLRQVEDVKARERVVDERLDPYSGRYFPQEARTESLAMLMRNERAVEKIIRMRTWGLIAERCGSEHVEADRAFDAWRLSRR
ncbi:hypothetical protein EKO04_005763 [Ascochyta lentis]|uniref:Caffeine-induced death protein Cid2 n=1 Tax=Ascochyta lentis TaxID=205686 RepID=A0A8H7J407_9PLEO|nr:hypothetical protein EKO04_005763 [Ascochyta lentis]